MFGFLKSIFGAGSAPKNPYETPVGPAQPGPEAPSDPAPTVEQQIAQAIASKQKILAIKLLRQHTGLGLAESKRAIERNTWRSLLRE